MAITLRRWSTLSTVLLVAGVFTTALFGYLLHQHVTTPLHSFTNPYPVTATVIAMETTRTFSSPYEVTANIPVTCTSTLQWVHKQESYRNTYQTNTSTQKNIWPPLDCLTVGETTDLIINGDHPREYARPLDALITTVLLTITVIGGVLLFLAGATTGILSIRD